MKKNIFVITLVLILPILICSGCGNSKKTNANYDQNERITLRLSHIVSPDHPWHKGLEKFAEKVKIDTSGQVVIDIYPNASLSENNERTMVEQVQVGTLEMALFPSSLGDNIFAAFTFPFQFETREAANKMLVSDIALNMLNDLKGIKGLGYWENGYRQITNNKHPIVTPDDFKGVKIRVPQAPQILANIKALGANAVSVSLGELYLALQQGLVDGQENVLSIIYNERFYEVQRFCTVCNYSYTPQILGINIDVYNNLSDDIKQVLLEASKEMALYTSQLLEEQDKVVIGELRKNKMDVHVSSPEEIAKFKELTDTEALRDEYRKIVGQDLMNKFMAKAREINRESTDQK
ncbi:MAG: DctP family TRAP transporter solute-binding subunit [Bacillota bacterium]